MKETKPTIPNLYLRSERERRGWSRTYVAEKIGLADPKTLGRWERGISAPTPHFRQKLCELFGKAAQNLGLIESTYNEQQAELNPSSDIQRTLSSFPASFLYDSAIPSTVGATGLVGRDKLLRSLKQHLYTRGHPTYVALHGLPGVGKTTLVVALAHNHEVWTHFRNGVLWARVGPKPDIPGLLSRWGALLGIPVAQMEKLTTCEAWAEAIHSAINTRQLLLIIDDVWTIEDALSFKVGGLNCACLITTRFPEVALHFSLDGSITIPELHVNDGLAILTYFVPELASSELQAMRELVQLVGGLPLALTLMGKHLQKQSYSGQPRRVKAALERLYDAKERLQLAEPQAALERNINLPVGTPFSLQTVIEASDCLLDDDARKVLYALSIFPAKPNSFSEEIALAVCAMPVETLDTLTDAGLLEGSGPGRYTLHQIIVDYARTKQSDRCMEARLVAYIANYVQQYKMDYEALTLESSNVLAALEIAYEVQMQAELVQISCSFAPFLYMHGSYALAEKHLQRGYAAATVLEDCLGIMNTLRHLGEVMRKCGNYAQAEAYLKTGLQLARQLEDTEQVSSLLGSLAVVLELQGSYAQAEAYYLESLAMAREYHLHEHICRLLADLGVLTGQQGNFERAEAYLEEALALARQIGLHQGVCVFLTTLGWILTERGNYEQAEVYLKEGHALAYQIGSRERIGSLLWALGMTATERGNYKQAEAYLNEGLSLARQLSHRELISELLLKLGVVAIMQGGHAQAEGYLREGLTIARLIGHRGLICASLSNLGENAVIQKDYDQAEEYLQEGLALARQLGHRRRISVLLANLGMQANKRGNYIQAEAYLQEGLVLARQLGSPQLVCTLLYHQGDCQLSLRQSQLAASSFQEMLSSAPKGCQVLIANAQYGLARVAVLQNNICEARQLGQASLNVFEKIGHYYAREIRCWLDTLSSTMLDARTSA